MISDQTRLLAHQLRLFGIHAHMERRSAEALASQMHPLEFLRLLLEDEALFRKDRVAKTLATRAGFRSQAAIEPYRDMLALQRNLGTIACVGSSSYSFAKSSKRLTWVGPSPQTPTPSRR